MDGGDELEAVRAGGFLSAFAQWRARRDGLATFRRIADGERDRRREPRRNARLRWGKALDGAGRFLCECLVADVARDGVRLRLVRNIALPSRFQFFDDGSGAVYAARIIWRRETEIGCRLFLAPERDKAELERRMKSKYYAL